MTRPTPGTIPTRSISSRCKKSRKLADGAAFRARTSDELDAAARAIEDLAAGETLAPPSILYRELWPYLAALAFVASLGLAFAQRAPR